MIKFLDLMSAMNEIIYFLAIALISSTASAIYYWQLSKKLKKRPDSVELQEFLRDLLSGSALLHVSRVDSADIVLRGRRR
jgi:hypothetical protein